MKEISNIREQQLILVDGLSVLKKACEKTGIEMFLSNGTLLGAVKYGGFVPWDDDVDVMIPRDDYDKLIGAFEDTDDWELVSKERYSEWKMPYAKLSHKKTTAMEATADMGRTVGLSVDIFPVDFFRGGRKIASMQAAYLSLLRRFMTNSLISEFETRKTGIKKLILILIYKFSRLVGSDRIYDAIIKQVKVGKKSGVKAYKGSVSWAPYGTRELIPCELFDEKATVLFEGGEYNAIKEYNYYLHRMYGDYTIDPPLEKQQPHHDMRVWKRD